MNGPTRVQMSPLGAMELLAEMSIHTPEPPRQFTGPDSVAEGLGHGQLRGRLGRQLGHANDV